MRFNEYNSNYEDDMDIEIRKSKRRKLVLTLILGVILVILIVLLIGSLNRTGDIGKEEPEIDEYEIDEEPTEVPDNSDTDGDMYSDYKTEYGTYEFLSETEKENVEQTIQRVANIRYNGEYTDEDYEFILNNFDEESAQMIDSAFADIPDGKKVSSDAYVDVTNWVEDTEERIKQAKDAVKNYPYKTYSDYLHGEFPEMYSDNGVDESEGESVDSVPNWCLTIFIDYDDGSVKWTGCSPQDAKESGILDMYLNEIYPAIYGEEVSEEDRAFDYDAYEKNSAESIEQRYNDYNREPMSENEWHETYKVAKIPKYIYTSDCVVKEGNEYRVYYSSFGDIDSLDIKVNGYDYTIYKETEEPGWVTCKGNELFNFTAHVSSETTSSLDNAREDIQVSLGYSGYNGSDKIEDSVFIDIALLNDGKIHLYYIGDLNRCSSR